MHVVKARRSASVHPVFQSTSVIHARSRGVLDTRAFAGYAHGYGVDDRSL